MNKYLPNQHELRQAVFTAIALIVLLGIGSFVAGLVKHALWYGSDRGDMMYRDMDDMGGKMYGKKIMMNHEMDDMSMDSMMMDMNMSLEGLKGDELDEAFLQEMIVHHEGAVEMAKTLKAGTKRPELLKFADDIINVQTKEVSQMESWLDTWFPIQK